MFVGTAVEVADECARAVPGVPLLRVKNAAAAVARMLVTRPFVVVLDDTLKEVEVKRVVDCARDVGAQVVHASKAGAELGAAVQSALLTAEQKRTRPAAYWSQRPAGPAEKLLLPEGPFPFSIESIDERVEPGRIGAYVLLQAEESRGDLMVVRVGRSDTDMNRRLKTYLGGAEYAGDERYDLVTYYSFAYCETAESAFATECVVYHDWEPPLNDRHPGKPRGSEARCPVRADDACETLDVEE
jgi:hypothetical protein